ncbi:MAG: RNA polymerase sigma factor [Solirubrobacteraceae bacterium]
MVLQAYGVGRPARHQRGRLIELEVRREAAVWPPVRGDEEELFRHHQRALMRAVGKSVNASQELIEDACQSAWLALLRFQPDRTPALFAWLRTVAVRHAYRLSRQEWRDARLEDLGGDQGWQRLLGGAGSLDDALEARRALATLAALPVLQREDLALLIGGYSYREIAQRASGGTRSLNNVNKRLTKARTRIRRLEAAAPAGPREP